MNVTLVWHPDGKTSLHRADCPAVSEAREREWPLLTLFDISKLPEDYPVAGCIELVSSESIGVAE